MISITGATGFLGRHCVSRLAADGHHVRVLVTPGKVLPLTFNKGTVEIIYGYLQDSTAIKKLLFHADILIHLAAAGVQGCDRQWDKTIESNISIIPPLMETAAECGVTKIITTGTSLEYQGFGILPHRPWMETPIPKCFETSLIAPFDPYGATKAAGGLILRTLAGSLGIDVWYLRLSPLYGTDDDADKLIPAAISAARNDIDFPMTEGKQIRDWLYIEDAVEAIRCAVEKKPPDKVNIVNIGTGNPITLMELVHSIFRINGASLDRIKATRLNYRFDEPHCIVMNNSLAQTVLGWQPSKKNITAQSIANVLYHT